jgi:HAD superfamily hydrolase (TIGR01509 family)
MSSDTSQSVSTPKASRRRTSRTDTPPRSHISEGRASRPRAVLFDFNGTLSDDEPVLYAIYAELCGREGRPLDRRSYFDRLAGLSDEAIFEAWLGHGHPRLAALVAERIALYRERVADGSTVGEPVRAAVRYAAERVPVGVVSGAARAEIEPVLAAAGLAEAVSFVVAADDVRAGKPDPEGYLRALERLGGGVRAAAVVVVEDTEAGVAAAKAAGMRVVAVTGTHGAARLAAADEVAEAVQPPLMRRLLA